MVVIRCPFSLSGSHNAKHQNRQCGLSTHQDSRSAAMPSQWAPIRKSQAPRQKRIRHRPKGRIGTYRTPGHHLSAQGGIDRAPDCSYRHICLECHGQHREPECPAKPPRNHPFGRTPATVPAVTEGTINSPPSCTHMIHVNYNQAPINEAQLDSASHIESCTHSISSNRTGYHPSNKITPSQVTYWPSVPCYIPSTAREVGASRSASRSEV
jgi:hypothetical protein